MSTPTPTTSHLISADCLRQLSIYHLYHPNVRGGGLRGCMGMMIMQALNGKHTCVTTTDQFLHTCSGGWNESMEKLFTDAGYTVHTFADSLIVIEW